MVIFSVYPLKFLFSSWLGGGGGGMRSFSELFLVYRVYGVGLASIRINLGTCLVSVLLSCLPVHP